jgi:hypothetical protein
MVPAAMPGGSRREETPKLSPFFRIAGSQNLLMVLAMSFKPKLLFN